jgi:hypothetical protein
MSKPISPRTPQIPRAPTQNILLFLIAFRLVNAFAVRTFFQPDEYFQSLEPAWQIAFGQGQGAWVTWVSERDRVNTWLWLTCPRNGGTNSDPHYILSSSPLSIKQPISSPPPSACRPLRAQSS